MAGTRQLKVEIIGDARNAQAAFKNLGNDSVGLSGLMKNSIGIGAAAAVVGFGLKAASTFTNVGKEVLKLQRYVGGTPEEMSKLRFAAQQTGIDVDTLTTSLGKLSKGIQTGTVDSKAIGVEFKTTEGKVRPLNDILLDLSGKFASMPNGAEKTATAMQLFGKAGAQMIPFLNKGKAGLQELEKEAAKFGVVLTDKNLDAIRKNTVAHRELNAAMQGLQIQIGQYVLPALTNLTKHLVGIVQAGIGLEQFFQHNAVAAGALATVLGVALAPAALNAATTVGMFALALAGNAIGAVAGVIDGVAASFSGVAVAEGAATAAAIGFEIATGGTLAIVAGAVALVVGAFKLLGDGASHSTKEAEDAGKAFASAFSRDVAGSTDELTKLNDELEIMRGRMGKSAVAGYVAGRAIDKNSDEYKYAQSAATQLGTSISILTAEQQAAQEPGAVLADATKRQADEAKKTSDAYAQLHDIIGEHATALVAMQGLPLASLNNVISAEQALTTGMASSFGSATSVVEAFADKTKVSIKDVNKFLADQVTAARDWSKNMAALAFAGIDHGLLDTLAQAGPKAAPLVKALLDDVAAGNRDVINNSQTDLRTILGQTQATIGSYEAPFYATGGNLGSGIVNGMANAINDGKVRIIGMLNGIVRYTNSHFGIASPSKVTRDKIGIPLGQGVVVGFEHGLKGMNGVVSGIDFSAPSASRYAGGGVEGKSLARFGGGNVYHIDASGAVPGTAEMIVRALDERDRRTTRELTARGVR